jgi:hypothetical protein
MGPFEHSSMKRLRVVPTPPELEEAGVGSTTKQDVTRIAMDIYGPILPSVNRKLLMISRNCLLKDEVNRLSIPTSMDDNNALDLSRYIVLQMMILLRGEINGNGSVSLPCQLVAIGGNIVSKVSRPSGCEQSE